MQQAGEAFDCLIIGGGPAGLTAAIYLARFHLSVLVVDGGQSRAASIPITHNHAGFPEGIAGTELLGRMRAQATKYGTGIVGDTVVALSYAADGFIITAQNGNFAARSVLLATGVINNAPDMPADLHDAALARGLLRYCPICDGYEATDRQIAVIGGGERGAREALFLRSYSPDVTLVTPTAEEMPGNWTERLHAAGIALVPGPIAEIAIEADQIVIATPRDRLRFDTLYPALGTTICSDLAGNLGARRSDEGCLIVDAHQRTSIPGLYAAGDVVLGLDQISHAMGEGGVAATTIRNDLSDRSPNWR